MKQNNFSKLMAFGAVSALALSTAFAQVTTKETTTTTGTTGTGVSASTTTSTSTLDGTGTITTFTPGEYMMVRTEASAEPVRYYTSKNVTIVDQTGAVVEPSLLRSDLPVRYTYVKEGDRMVVSKITVQKPLAEIRTTETTTTTTTRK
jgi:hypothetical protein